MKKNWFLIVAVFLLVALVIWILTDLFPGQDIPRKNQFDYGMESLRKPDTIPSYTEILPIRPDIKELWSIASDPSGKIYAGGKDKVEIFLSGGKKTGGFAFRGFASCIAWMTPGLLVIGMENHVEIYTISGKLVARQEPPDSNSMITSIAVSGNVIFLADAGNKTVWKYDRNGKVTGKIGEKDPERNIPGFVVPSPFFDVAVSPAGELWVANPGRHELENYKPDGTLVSHWGEASITLEGFTGCCNPSHFTILPDGCFVTSEKGLERVKIYSPGGKYLRLVAAPGSFDEGTKGLDLAAGINGRILVLDPRRNQVRIFLPNEIP